MQLTEQVRDLRFRCVPSCFYAPVHAQRVAAAVDSLTPVSSPFGLPAYVAPLPAGSILVSR